MVDLKKLKVVFISHESSLSGAPILLLNLLQLLKQRGFKFSIILKRGGELDDRFLATGKTFILKPVNYQRNKAFLLKVVDYFFYRVRLLFIMWHIRNADVVFSNTITNGRFLKQISPARKPVLTYVHELESVIEYYSRSGDSDLSFSLSTDFCSPSFLVSENLKNHNICNKRIFQLNYYLPTVKAVEFADKREEQTNFFAKYRIPPNKFYVVGMGTATLRKGIDLFIEACALVCHVDPNVHFVWIGDFIDDHERRMATEMMQNLGLNESSFTLTGFISPRPNNLLPFDILTLTSKEDPYPLVVLEAAFLKIPSIAFKRTGGIVEFIEDDAGFILEERSGQSLSETIIYLRQNQLLIAEKGNAAFKKVTERHSNPDLIIEQFETAVAHVMNKSLATSLVGFL